MTQLVRVVWLPALLLLLLFWLPGCVPLHGPSTVTGIVGKSLSIECQYEEKFKPNNKYWCRDSLTVLWKDIVTTKGSEEARNGRVTIRDHPDNLTFIVTLEKLTLEDAGTYMCAVDIPAFEGFLKVHDFLGIDKYFKIKLSVVLSEVPGPTLETPVVSTSLPTKGPTQGSTTEDYHKHHDPQALSLPVLLSVLVLLLFLLVGTSLLAWRMFQKRLVKADVHPELSQNLRQAAEQRESQYVNLQLHTWPLREEPVLPSQVEVEYSTLALPQEELHYTSVAFDSQRQDSHTNGDSLRQPQDQNTEYSEIQKPRKGLSDPHL
ncbi:CMRF35-like molecule 8 isoform X2 [Apodemus sylvaticus]|uniref:CMRF35-like molecule 8 isoform X2 n=1 Tax=Apodemus sylvaticus TaxID=10129 RepID=UPI002241AF2F|nr:CMRF35-like molecule 8 isoform X2 [Apodemus sylvaticus]